MDKTSKTKMNRTVVNYKDAPYTTYNLQGKPQDDILWYNISWSDQDDTGFFLVEFKPGGISIPHEHLGFEEFVVLEGEITDHDGYTYRAGDCVSLPAGSRHRSTSATGAKVAVFVRGGFRTIPESEL